MEAAEFQFVPLVLSLGTTGTSLAPSWWHLQVFVCTEQVPCAREPDPVQLRELNQEPGCWKNTLDKKGQSFSVPDGVSQCSL